jgi:hypothetical protein
LPDECRRLGDHSAGTVEDRFDNVREAWQAVELTGHGEAVRIGAKAIYGIEELTAATLQEAVELTAELRQPEERLRLLRDVAGLDHVQIDDGARPPATEPTDVEFFLHDLPGLTSPPA